MLTKQEIFVQIQEENIDVIWEAITVDFDNTLQLPLSFCYRDKKLEVLDLIGAYRDSSDDPSITYLVRTVDGVYSLYLKLQVKTVQGALYRASWILHSRIRAKENREMLVDIRLKQLADFHGHLCPELVIGYRASMLAQKILMIERMWQSQIDVIVENTTSALDAVQMLTGCTVGNTRLRILDHNLHIYTFIPRGEPALRVKLRSEALSRPVDFNILEWRVDAGIADLSEISRYWSMVNQQVVSLLHLTDERLFDTGRLLLGEMNNV